MKRGPLKRIFPAEFASELKEFLTWSRSKGRDPSEVLVVALQPEVRVLCLKQRLPHVDTLSFFDNEAQKRVLTKSHELATLLSDNLVFDVEGPIRDVLKESFIFYSRFYINHLLWIIEVLRGIRKTSGNIEICVFEQARSKKSYAGNSNVFLSNQDRFVGGLSAKYCAAHRLPIEVLGQAVASAPLGGKDVIGGFEQFVLSVARKLYQCILARLSGKKIVFLTAPSYNLDRLGKDLQARFAGTLSVASCPESLSAGGYLKAGLREAFRLAGAKTNYPPLVTIPTKIFNSRDSNQENKYRSEIRKAFTKFGAEHHRSFSYENCTFWDEFERKVETGLLDYLVTLQATEAGQRKFLELLRPGLLVSAVSLGEYQSWAEVAQSLGIPALVIPQKMIVAPSDPYAKIEQSYVGRAQVTDSYRNVASQSPEISRYLRWSQYKGNILETGNLIFSKIDPVEKKEKRKCLFVDNRRRTKTIVWAPSMKTRRSRRFYVLETLDELVDAMKDVFEMVEGMEDVHMVFRIHPGGAITKDDILALTAVPENVSISERGTFESVLTKADLLLSFSSTSILESLMNNIPVVLFDKWKRYNHLDADRVADSVPFRKSCVYYVDDPKVLSSSIRWILNAHCGDQPSSDLFDQYLARPNGRDDFLDFVEECLGLSVD